MDMVGGVWTDGVNDCLPALKLSRWGTSCMVRLVQLTNFGWLELGFISAALYLNLRSPKNPSARAERRNINNSSNTTRTCDPLIDALYLYPSCFLLTISQATPKDPAMPEYVTPVH